MEAIEKLSNQGWHITSEGLELLTGGGTSKDLKSIINSALDADLKDVGKPVLSSELNKSKIEQLVLQIQKIKNVAAPKSNEDSQAAPRMLKLILTDGFTYCQALEIENIPFLSLSKTAPGMKLLIKNAKIISGYIFLQPQCCVLLGGKVPALFEKWEVSKSISKHTRHGSFDGDGPPPWVNFGQRILTSVDSQSFKSLENKVGKDQAKQNSNFDSQRQDAIAEATSGAVKKVFGGGIKQSIQLKEKKSNYSSNRTNYQERERPRRAKKDTTDEEKLQKPSEKVSLFDFLEDKLSSSDPGNSGLSSKSLPNDDISHNKAPRFQNQNPPKNYRPRDNNQSYNFTQNKSQVLNDTQTVNSLTNNMERMSINSQFASRSLKQHLNLGNRGQHVERNQAGNLENNVNQNSTWQWKVGDLCMAKYWEDNKYYNAAIVDLTDKTCVVQFSGYGNYEEVLHTDCIPVMSDVDKKSGEFRKGGNRFYVNNRNFYKTRNDK